MTTCLQCHANFSIEQADYLFYERVGAIPPKLCPMCRVQRRLAFRNERTLYVGTCEGCRKRIVSIYSPDKDFHLYCPDCWWSDKWDPVDVGRPFDFTRPFFDQFADLLRSAKLISLWAANNENSDYVNKETDDKNCYLNFGGHFNEDCLYNTYSLWGKNNVDNYWAIRSELCYECIEIENCYACTFSRDCLQCVDCHYCRDCVGCQNCIGCFGLRQKQYYLFNKPLTKEEYEKVVPTYLGSYSRREKTRLAALKHFLTFPHRCVKVLQSENAQGDRIYCCKNVYEAYLSEKCEDCRYIQIAMELKDCSDLTSTAWSELAYDCGSSKGLYLTIHSSSVTETTYSLYCYNCSTSKHLFGCIGLTRKEFCILNKQYTKSEYEKLLPKVLEHMKETGEFGFFFPPSISPFCYNESGAYQYFPLTKEEVLLKEWQWRDEVGLPQPQGGSYVKVSALPDTINDVDDAILSKLIECEESGKIFKFQKAELQFYRNANLPLPRVHHEVRHKSRFDQRNPMRLWSRTCEQCEKSIQSSFSPERPEKIECEECYTQAFA